MFATAAFAQEPFATHGIVKVGVSSLSANATQTATGIHDSFRLVRNDGHR